MNINTILLLGDPRLYEISTPVEQEELPKIREIVPQMAAVIQEFRATYGLGRAIAAPQLGIMKRLIVMHVDNNTTAFINPTLSDYSDEQLEIWDDCMSFPHLLVKVKRHKRCKIQWKDLYWQDQERWLDDDMAELLQHEYDHLNGILATMRASDDQSFKWK